ncbi:hypothetical protein K0B90_05845 [bacterium]|nr:hypothetical protein [bacterium]
MLGIFQTAVLIHDVEEFPGDHAGEVFPGLLRGGDELYPRLVQLTLVESELVGIPEEPGEGMHHHGIEGRRIPAGLRDHLLEYRPPIIGCRCPRLDIFHSDGVPLSDAPLLDLADLIRNG